ncbi:MFS-type transporter SLC18B1-like isoform X2 [Athalia rosae]|uniref:MFS-type transporter SLC18B1-like isoform X2 n=1 Tax=Athalia rosae TaxID=37344 RepID=UPI000625027D|nr:MFS-type transporter SLC18B1-like isoform X2 [Athalia rosae]
MNVQQSPDVSEVSNRMQSISDESPEAMTPQRRGRGSHVRSASICGSTTPAEIQRVRERLLRTQRTPRPSTIWSFNRRQKLALLTLSIVDFVSFCSMSIMAPFFPKEAEVKGMPESISGLVFSFYAMMMFLSAPIFGIILPRIGAKFLFISGLMVAGVCNVLFGFVDAIVDYKTFVIFCFIIRGLEALGASAFSTAGYIFVVDIFPDNVGAVLGILETFVGLGMSTGPAIGGLLYSIGGFGLPFYVLGGILVAIAPINFCLIPSADNSIRPIRRGSRFKLLKLPAVLVIGSVVVIASSTWSFLDPTLEPHLRQYSLSTKQVGLVFLLFSALYGICSPFWGWLADKTNSHWSMMTAGLLLSSVGLAVLGPTSLVSFLPNIFWMNIVALCVLGVSVSLTLLPSFQSILANAIRGGCADELSTYSIVAGFWSCAYSLGEVIGPSLGGFISEQYGFQVCSTVMAGLNICLAIITIVFFSFQTGNRRDISRNSTSKDSGIQSSGSLTHSGSLQGQDEQTSLLQRSYDHGDHMRDQARYYANSRSADRPNNDVDWNTEVTDFRGTVNVTAYGACEV